MKPTRPGHARASSSSTLSSHLHAHAPGAAGNKLSPRHPLDDIGVTSRPALPTPTPAALLSLTGASRRPPGLRARSTAPYARSPASTSDIRLTVTRHSSVSPSKTPDAVSPIPLVRRNGLGNGSLGGGGKGDGPGNGREPDGSGMNRLPGRKGQHGEAPASRIRRAPTKEPAHLPLHRRLLFPTYPPDKPLPPIVLGVGPGIEEVNERLYHLIALLLRAYVLSWYPSITRDRSLLPHLLHTVILPILSPILTDIYEHPERIVELVLLDLPRVLEVHVRTYWQARAALVFDTEFSIEGRSDSGGRGRSQGRDVEDDSLPDCPGDNSTNDQAEVELGKAYHARLPLKSVEPYTPPSPAESNTEQTAQPASKNGPAPDHSTDPYRTPVLPGQYIVSPTYLTALSSAILQHRLPPAEYASDVERIMATEILGRVVLGSVLRKLGEGWFWLGLVLRFLGEPRDGTDKNGSETGEAEEGEVKDDAASAFGTSSQSSGSPRDAGIASWAKRILGWVWRVWIGILAVISMTMTGLSALATLLSSLDNDQTSSSPAHRSGAVDVTSPWLALGNEILGTTTSHPHPAPWAVRLVWGTVEVLLTLLSPLIDRLVPRLLSARLTHELGINLIDLLEAILLPADGYPGPVVPDPTEAETRDMRARVERRLREVLPRWLTSPPSAAQTSGQAVIPGKGSAPGRGGSDSGSAEDDGLVQRLVEPLLSPGCNAHLMAMLLDTVVGALEPDLVAVPVPAAPDKTSSSLPSEKSQAAPGHAHAGDEVHEGDPAGVRWRTARRAGALVDAMS